MKFKIGDIVEIDMGKLENYRYVDKTILRRKNYNNKYHSCANIFISTINIVRESPNELSVQKIEPCGCCYIRAIHMHLPSNILRRIR